MRERAAEDLTAAQVEAHNLRRQARAETMALVNDARTEADQLRAQARQLLSDARTEAHALAARRTQIEAELSQLSGVIEALAVPEASTSQIPSQDSPSYVSNEHQPANLR